MRKGPSSDRQIIAIPKEREPGMSTAKVCRRPGVSQLNSIPGNRSRAGWRFRRRLKALEDENRKLKNLLAEQVMDNATLKECWQKTSDAGLLVVQFELCNKSVPPRPHLC